MSCILADQSALLETVEKLVSPAPTVRVMAANILGDRNFEGHSSSDIRRIVDIILRGPGVILAEDGVLDSAGTPLRFSEREGRTEAVAHLQARLEQGNEDRGAALAVASSLARHAVASDAISQWWWQNCSGTTQWLVIGATLGAFDSVSIDQTRQLQAAYKENHSDTRWYASLLAEGGYDGTDPELLHAVALDLNEGAVEDIEVPNNDSHIGRLIRDALSVPHPPAAQTKRQQQMRAYGYGGPIDGARGTNTWMAIQRFAAADGNYTGRARWMTSPTSSGSPRSARPATRPPKKPRSSDHQHMSEWDTTNLMNIFRTRKRRTSAEQ